MDVYAAYAVRETMTLLRNVKITNDSELLKISEILTQARNKKDSKIDLGTYDCN